METAREQSRASRSAPRHTLRHPQGLTPIGRLSLEPGRLVTAAAVHASGRTPTGCITKLELDTRLPQQGDATQALTLTARGHVTDEQRPVARWRARGYVAGFHMKVMANYCQLSSGECCRSALGWAAIHGRAQHSCVQRVFGQGSRACYA